ncbi:MAG: hypothetical protein QXS41_01610 [Candidatus Woesearchaeota archaeon]
MINKKILIVLYALLFSLFLMSGYSELVIKFSLKECKVLDFVEGIPSKNVKIDGDVLVKVKVDDIINELRRDSVDEIIYLPLEKEVNVEVFLNEEILYCNKTILIDKISDENTRKIDDVIKKYDEKLGELDQIKKESERSRLIYLAMIGGVLVVILAILIMIIRVKKKTPIN